MRDTKGFLLLLLIAAACLGCASHAACPPGAAAAFPPPTALSASDDDLEDLLYDPPTDAEKRLDMVMDAVSLLEKHKRGRILDPILTVFFLDEAERAFAEGVHGRACQHALSWAHAVNDSLGSHKSDGSRFHLKDADERRLHALAARQLDSCGR